MKPDFGKDKFEITITVHENCQTFIAKPLNGEPITYQAIIGVLESVKQKYMFDQMGINLEEYRKWQKARDKKKTKNQSLNPRPRG